MTRRPPDRQAPYGRQTSTATLVTVDRYAVEGRWLVGHGREPDGTPVRFVAAVNHGACREWVEPVQLLEPVRLDRRVLLRGL